SKGSLTLMGGRRFGYTVRTQSHNCRSSPGQAGQLVRSDRIWPIFDKAGMVASGSVALQRLLDRLHQGDRPARQPVLERACARLRRLARQGDTGRRQPKKTFEGIHQNFTGETPEVGFFAGAASAPARALLIAAARQNPTGVAKNRSGTNALG